jgi:hypothetical protein
MKNMETVREIARGDDQWLKYDQKFRNTNVLILLLFFPEMPSVAY